MKHAGSSKPGKNAAKCKRYRNEDRRAKSKVKKIAKSNGPRAAAYWMREHNHGIQSIILPRTRSRAKRAGACYAP